MQILALAFAIISPGLFPKELSDHYRKCTSYLLLTFAFYVLGYFWGAAFFTAVSRNDLPNLIDEGKELLDACPDDAKAVFNRPNGHAVRTFVR